MTNQQDPKAFENYEARLKQLREDASLTPQEREQLEAEAKTALDKANEGLYGAKFDPKKHEAEMAALPVAEEEAERKEAEQAAEAVLEELEEETTIQTPKEVAEDLEATAAPEEESTDSNVEKARDLVPMIETVRSQKLSYSFPIHEASENGDPIQVSALVTGLFDHGNNTMEYQKIMEKLKKPNADTRELSFRVTVDLSSSATDDNELNFDLPINGFLDHAHSEQAFAAALKVQTQMLTNFVLFAQTKYEEMERRRNADFLDQPDEQSVETEDENIEDDENEMPSALVEYGENRLLEQMNAPMESNVALPVAFSYSNGVFGGIVDMEAAEMEIAPGSKEE